MFRKEDMMVSLLVAEEKVKNTEERYKEIIDKQTEEHTSIINEMKNNSNQKGVVKIFRNNKYEIGEPTPFYSHGIQLFTGDEVEFKSGRRGIVVKRNKIYEIMTNKGIAELVTEEFIKEMTMAGIYGEGYVLGSNLKITKHFNMYKDGEEVAKGRKGAAGFIISLK